MQPATSRDVQDCSRKIANEILLFLPDMPTIQSVSFPSKVAGIGRRRYGRRLQCTARAWRRTVADDDMKAELERLRAENERLKQRGRPATSMKVSEKGAVSVYGMGRFPVTLYKEQWLKLLDMAEDIRAFIAANDGQLKAKE